MPALLVQVLTACRKARTGSLPLRQKEAEDLLQRSNGRALPRSTQAGGIEGWTSEGSSGGLAKHSSVILKAITSTTIIAMRANVSSAVLKSVSKLTGSRAAYMPTVIPVNQMTAMMPRIIISNTTRAVNSPRKKELTLDPISCLQIQPRSISGTTHPLIVPQTHNRRLALTAHIASLVSHWIASLICPLKPSASISYAQDPKYTLTAQLQPRRQPSYDKQTLLP